MYVHFENDEQCKLFFQQAEKEGFTFGDGVKPTAKHTTDLIAVMIVICAPYKHLVKQWCEDVEKAFPEAKIVLVSSENNNWETQITQEIIRKKYQSNNQIIIISTIASFKMERFSTTINKSTDDKLLIVDEAHRFSDRSEDLKNKFKYMLGLSATPFSGTSAIKGRELMSFFGGEVFSLPIEKALNKGYLVPYNYYPISQNFFRKLKNQRFYNNSKIWRR